MDHAALSSVGKIIDDDRQPANRSLRNFAAKAAAWGRSASFQRHRIDANVWLGLFETVVLSCDACAKQLNVMARQDGGMSVSLLSFKDRK
ncbi:hypothetical protein [Neisseria iguanae]|uniref:Uncharacterized protein n=1 Tax=Neisseria iguanae TaxID=90242 RepID=A0A2P7TZY9_9NEIS|nr:hypothetical protein [Neisseria iguanae]PSJ80302.1 hypothetical protein C7N83_07115 [Neisseria iguanae]